MVSKLRIMNTIIWFLQGNRLKVEEYEPIVWLLQGNRLKVADYELIPLYGSSKEIVSKLRMMNITAW